MSLFVTLEGIEGSGKSTQALLLQRALESRGHAVLPTREPGGTALGAVLRGALLDPESRGMSPLAELLLYCADRAEHVDRVVRPGLQAGRVVLCDRFSDATRAYQGFGRGLGLELVDRVNVGHLDPDLTVLLDLPARDGLERARQRNQRKGLAAESRFEDEELAFHERVRAGYLTLAASEPGRLRPVDAARAEAAVAEDVLALALEAIRRKG